LWDFSLWRITGVLHHLEQLALFQVHGWTFATLILEVAPDGVDMVGEFLCVEHEG
jgi:hypothetical protein